MTPWLTFQSVQSAGTAVAADVLSRGVSDYVVPVSFTGDEILGLTQSDDICLDASQVLLDDGAAVGAALVARRGMRSRILGMGVVPEARRRGHARALMLHLLEQARARGDAHMELEVVEQNTSAAALYASLGFEPVRRLFGYARAADIPDKAESIRALPVGDVCDAMVRSHAFRDLPWQLSPETLGKLPASSRAYCTDKAQVVLMGIETPVVTVRALLPCETGTWADASLLLRALAGAHPGKSWRVSSLWPEEHAAAFENAGYTRSEFVQLQMRCCTGLDSAWSGEGLG